MNIQPPGGLTELLHPWGREKGWLHTATLMASLSNFYWQQVNK